MSLEAALAALRSHDPSLALDLLRDCSGAHAHAYRGQAYRDLGLFDEADRELMHAIHLAKQAGDTSGVSELRALRAPITGALAARAAADTEREQLLAADESAMDGETLLRLADALAGDPRAAEVARRARALAVDPRGTVLALLAEARADPERAAERVREAHQTADEADDHNLIAAVARTAKLLGVELLRPRFG